MRGMVAARRATAGSAAAPPPAAKAGDVKSRPLPASLFVSFLDGTEELVHALRAGLTGALETGTRLAGLERTAAGRYNLALECSGDKGGARVMEADAVLLAIPAFSAADLLRTLAPAAAGLLDGIRYVSTGTISLAFQGEAVAQRLPGFGLVIPRSEKRPLNALTWSSTKFCITARRPGTPC